MAESDRASVLPRAAVRVAVVMEREKAPNQWQDWRFRIADVVQHEDEFGLVARVLRDDGRVQRMLHPNFTLELFRDQAEGYWLNLSSGSPVWFVVWRIDDADPSRAWPETVSLSYTEAAPWLDAFIAAASVTSQCLMSIRKIENWVGWIVVDIVAVGVYCWKGLYPTTGLYAIFLALSVAGLLSWWRQLAADVTAEAEMAA